MRVNKATRFGEVVERSVGQDFPRRKMYPTNKKSSYSGNFEKITSHLRVERISEICEYAKFARFFIGREMELVEQRGVMDSTTGYYRFVHEKDRKALNSAAGWSDNKEKYLLERPKFRK